MFRNVEFTEKHKAILKDYTSDIEFFEGVTGSSKSLIASIKMVCRVLKSPAKQFFLIGESSATLERNFVANEFGIVSLFNSIATYKKQGTGGSRIELAGKTIYFASYSDKSKWKKILGSGAKGFMVDEINIADEDFIGELFTRIARNNAFLICTCNGDNPELLVYQRYLNKCTPRFIEDIPMSTLKELRSNEAEEPTWSYYHFGFKDNPKYTAEDVRRLMSVHPPSSWQYKTKILGERGKAEGVIYLPAITKENFITEGEIPWDNLTDFTIGVDLGGRDATVFTLTGFDLKQKIVYTILEYYHKNGVTDNFRKGDKEYRADFVEFYDTIHKEIGGRLRAIFVDSRELTWRISLENMFEATKRRTDILPSSKRRIKERTDTGILLLNCNRWKIVEDDCTELVKALKNCTYNKSKSAKDLRTEDSCLDSIDSSDYSQTTYYNEMR